MLKLLPVLEPDNCTGCVACVDACNPSCLEMQDGLPVLMNAAACTGSEHCVAACPTQALRMEWTACDGDPAVGRWQEGATASAV
jgi:Na+-translocating ferredoxin:NAD+ oxidoreductase RNF subunit RnfB